MKKAFFFHPFVFALLPTILLYSHNVQEAWPSWIVRPLSYSLVFGLISWFTSFVIFKDKGKASVLTSVWLIVFFSYGHTYLFVAENRIFSQLPFSLHAILLGAYILVLIAVFIALMMRRNNVDSLTTSFNVAALTLLLINLLPLIPLELKRAAALQRLKTYMAELHIKDAPYRNKEKSTYPDIYYFVFDRYANQSTLSEYFEYDNKDFLATLEKNNFFIAEQSIANYPNTFLSLSSSLNMTHLTFLRDILGNNYADQSVLYKELLNDNEVVQFLMNKGYKYYQLGSSWEPTKMNSLASGNYNLFVDFNEFESFLYENTLLNALIGKFNRAEQVFTGVSLLEIKSNNALYKLERIKELTSTPGPKFVFSHYLLPHPPYLYTDDCSALPLEEVRNRSDETGYIDQLKCANKIMNEISESIRKKNHRPTVIIFQSDEGPFIPQIYFEDIRYKETPNKDAYKIHARILNALYLTEKDNPWKPVDYGALGINHNLTPVNTFRLLFNYYFETEYELLENRSYTYTDSDRPYNFTEITESAAF